MRLEDPRRSPTPNRSPPTQPGHSPTELSARTFNASGVDATRPAERTFPSSQIAISQKSRCTSNPIALPTAVTTAVTSPSPDRATMNGRTVGTTTTTDTRSQRNRASRRGGHRKARARSPSSKTACPATFSQKAPIPISRTVSPDPDGALTRSFSCPDQRQRDADRGHMQPRCRLEARAALPVPGERGSLGPRQSRAGPVRVAALPLLARCGRDYAANFREIPPGVGDKTPECIVRAEHMRSSETRLPQSAAQ